MDLSTNEINTDEVTSPCRYLRMGSVASYSQATHDPHTATVNPSYSTGKQMKKVYSSNLRKWVNPNNICGSRHEPCGSQRCLTCPSFEKSSLFTSTVNGTGFILTHNQEFSCKSKNIIYLITCGNCKIQYVGKTTMPLHKRMNGHRINANNDCSNLLIAQHFTQGGHEFCKARIQIIDCVIEENKETGFLLDQKEIFWINTLCTAYPLGLNDNIRGYGNVSQGGIGDVYFTNSQIHSANEVMGNEKTEKAYSSIVSFLWINSNYSRVSLSHVYRNFTKL